MTQWSHGNQLNEYLGQSQLAGSIHEVKLWYEMRFELSDVNNRSHKSENKKQNRLLGRGRH